MIYATPARTPVRAAVLSIAAREPLLMPARQLWRSVAQALFHPYRPELHYMRGPGPKWREKHESHSHSAFERHRPLAP
jgi:hypothetical protein